MTTKLITPGELGPDFELLDTTDRPVRLSDHRGRPVVLAFLRGFQ
jgi:peroxiredoxin